MMKKGPMEKRYVYDVENHPMSVSEESRATEWTDSEVHRFRLKKAQEEAAQRKLASEKAQGNSSKG